ncbi:MAG TPA: hypothetical protein VHQ93_16265 [Chitinophagaceae bacterium]|jgi:hypothetical protein|nr:hypothetical protein [Chitinophagaceae bacterium]
MKKTTILLAIACITLFACNKNLLKLTKQSPNSNFNAIDSIPRVTALAMIQHFREHFADNTLVGLNDLDTMSVTLQISDLNKIFHLDSITRIRFLSAAYLPSNPDTSLHNKVTVLIQLKQGYHSNYYYYDSQLFGALCPPPPGCAVE